MGCQVTRTGFAALAALFLAAALASIEPEADQAERCVRYCAPHFPLVCEEHNVECSETLGAQPWIY